MGLDLAATNAVLYGRLATDSDGSAARALLGGASSVFPAERLNQVSGVVLPWAVWRARGTDGEVHAMRAALGSWFVYARPDAGQYKLLQIATAIEALYGLSRGLAVAGGRMYATTLAPFYDTTLALAGVEVRIRFRRLG